MFQQMFTKHMRRHMAQRTWQASARLLGQPEPCTWMKATRSAWGQCFLAKTLCATSVQHPDTRSITSLATLSSHSCGTTSFFVAIGQCTIAGAVGIWFFTPSGEKWKKATVCVSLKNAVWYHSGSLAFGSLILAIVVWLKWFMTWLAQQAKQTKNKVMEIVCKILAYVLWCFEKCVKFLNKNAYIQVALMGTNFCKSAKNAFFLILRNVLRFGVIAILSHIVHFIGMVLIIALTAVLGYFILGAMHPTVNPIFPTIIYTFIGWMTAKLFIGTFALAVDSTLQCFIAAEEMGAGNEFAPEPLKNFIDANAEEKSKCCDTCCCTIM